jgi:hypothetical protein
VAVSDRQPCEAAAVASCPTAIANCRNPTAQSDLNVALHFRVTGSRLRPAHLDTGPLRQDQHRRNEAVEQRTDHGVIRASAARQQSLDKRFKHTGNDLSFVMLHRANP